MDKQLADLTQKKILVTGGGGIGIGAGVCKVLSDCGARVILNEITLDKAKSAAESYPGAVPVAADISKEEEVIQMFDTIEKKVGYLDGIVNNAGIGLSKLAINATEEEFTTLYDTDLKGLWHVSKIFSNRLIERDKAGNIVNISSVHAKSTIAKYALYSSVKSAVEGLTRGMAIELGPYNIRVNAVGPGYVHAEQNYDLIKTWTDTPEKWVEEFVSDYQVLPVEITARDCGNIVAFLLSDLSRAVTGQMLYVDCGATIQLCNRSFVTKK